MVGSWLFDWIIWTSLIAGLFVAGVVYFIGRRTPRLGLRDEDIPWEDLLGLMQARYKDKSVEDEELPPDELMQSLLSQIPGHDSVPPPDVNWSNGAERRRSLRRWFNPIDVIIISPFHDHPVHGLVVNRSIGGLAILTDFEFAQDTVLNVRPMNAPAGIGYVTITVRHARKAAKLWVIGCQYKDDVMWNVKVWFG